MDRKSDEPLSRAIMRAIGWCDAEGGHGTGAHMVSTETLMAWAARAVLLEEAVRVNVHHARRAQRALSGRTQCSNGAPRGALFLCTWEVSGGNPPEGHRLAGKRH